MTSIPAFRLDPIVSSAIFLLICGVATYVIIYTCIVYKKDKKEIEEEERQKNTVQKQITEILALIIYLFISFTTMAWHITWILWVVYGLVEEIIKLIFMLRSKKNEK